MHLTAGELRRLLEDEAIEDSTLVYLAHQPTYPLQFKAERAEFLRVQGEDRIYIAEGGAPHDTPYLPGVVGARIGWSEDVDEDEE